MAELPDYRDCSLPLSDLELTSFCHVFKSLPTFTPSDQTIGTEDFRALVKHMRYNRSEEQIQGYIDHWENYNKGRLPLQDFLELSAVAHRTSVLFYSYALKLDKEQSGVITQEQVGPILHLMSLHDQKLSGKTTEDFMQEGDTLKNGNVSLEECAAWIEAHCASSCIWELSKTPFVWEDD